MHSHQKYHFNLLFSLFCIINFCVGQESEDLDNDYSEFWTDITIGKALNDKWTVGGDAGIRTALNNDYWKLFYLRPNINYKVKPFFNLTFGLGTFNTFSNDFSNVYEFRIYQDANFKGPKLGPFNFLHRVRLEQRFFNFSADDLDNEFSFRGRYLIGTRTDHFSLGGEKDWSGFISLEPFFPLGQGVTELLANNFRWDAALTYHVTEKFRIEFHYVLQTSEIFSNNDLRVLEHIFRFRVFQKL